MSDLYQRDFCSWSQEQAALLRAGRLGHADIENIAEEIDGMGRSEKRELAKRLAVLLLHLPKWQFQPSRRGPSWELSVANTRDQLEVHLNDNPSLKAHVAVSMLQAYRYARRDAAREPS